MKHALIAALVLGLAACASAQSARPLHSEMADKGPAVARPEGRMAMPTHDTEGALASLKTELKITAAQTKAWRAFAAAYRDFAASKPNMPMKHSGTKCCAMMDEDEHAASSAKDQDKHAASGDEHSGSGAKDPDEHAVSGAKDQGKHADSGAEDQDQHAVSGAKDAGEHAGSIVKRMEMHMTMMQSRLKALRKLNAALKPLYASLTKRQKKTADQMIPKVMKMGHMM